MAQFHHTIHTNRTEIGNNNEQKKTQKIKEAQQGTTKMLKAKQQLRDQKQTTILLTFK